MTLFADRATLREVDDLCVIKRHGAMLKKVRMIAQERNARGAETRELQYGVRACNFSHMSVFGKCSSSSVCSALCGIVDVTLKGLRDTQRSRVSMPSAAAVFIMSRIWFVITSPQSPLECPRVAAALKGFLRFPG